MISPLFLLLVRHEMALAVDLVSISPVHYRRQLE
jgi:hypothetical protein